MSPNFYYLIVFCFSSYFQLKLCAFLSCTIGLIGILSVLLCSCVPYQVGVLEELPDWTRKDVESQHLEGIRDVYRQKLEIAKHHLLLLEKKWKLLKLHEVCLTER